MKKIGPLLFLAAFGLGAFAAPALGQTIPGGGGGGSGITQLTGDVTAGPGSGSQASTLATVNVTPGTYGDSSHCASLTVNGKGLVTSASQSTSCPGGSSVTWPTSGDAVISNGTNSPAGVAPVNGDCLLGSGGAWTAGSCGGASSVSVTSSSSNIVVNPSPGTGTFTVGATYPISAQTGTSYTITCSNLGELVTFNNASSVAAALPAAGTSCFGSGASFDVQNIGAGTVTITPTTSTINGVSSLVVPQNTGCSITSDGTNYQVSACIPALNFTGGGSLVRANSPTLVTPNLGVPSVLGLANATGLVPSTGLSATGTPSSSTCLLGNNSWGSCASGGSGTVTTLTAGTNITFSSGATCTTTCTINASGGGASVSAFPNYISGMPLSTAGGSSTFGIGTATGAANDSTNAYSLALGSAWTKTTGSWASGTGNGCLDTGSVAANTWYWVFIISKAGGANPDVLCTAAANATTPASSHLPSTYTLYRYIGSMLTDSSSHWLAFNQIGRNKFLFSTTINNVNGATLTTSPVLDAVSVPPGINAEAIIQGISAGATPNIGALINSPLQASVAVDATGGNVTWVQQVASQATPTGQLTVTTDTSQEVRIVANGTMISFYLATIGWYDPLLDF